MAVKYAITNLINENTPLYASSEDTIYLLDYLYNERPSKPFRWLGDRGAPRPDPEWICVDLLAVYNVTLAAYFNHNLNGIYSADDFSLLGCDSECAGSGACNWAALPSGSCDEELLSRIVDNHNNSYKIIDCTHRHFRTNVSENNNPIPQIGEWFLGQAQSFSRHVHLQDNRPESPGFYMGNQETHYGQDHSNHLSTIEWESTLVFDNIEDPRVISEFQTFIRAVQENGGRFVIIPDDTKKFSYYVIVKNLRDYAQNIVYGQKRLKRWTLQLKSLVEGVQIL